MATTAHSAMSEYLRTGYEPDAEYVDGEIEERPVGEFDHGSWQAAIQLWFLLKREPWNIWVIPELRIQVSPTRFRVPDVTIVDRRLPREQILTRPPVAVFEVLSPEDRVTRMMVKLQDYERMGIKNIFVVDPQDGSAWKFGHGELAHSRSGSFEDSPCLLDWEQIRKYVAGE